MVKMSQIGPKQETRYASDKDFSYIYAMNFTFDLETWIKVTAQYFLNCSVYVKYETKKDKRRVCIL